MNTHCLVGFGKGVQGQCAAAPAVGTSRAVGERGHGSRDSVRYICICVCLCVCPGYGPGLLIRRARLLLPVILGPKPLPAVSLLKHMKEENNQLPKALE